jgi:PKD domain
VRLRVRDSSGELSPVFSRTFRVNAPPVAGISILNPQLESGQKLTVPLANQPFTFTGIAVPALPGASPAPGCPAVAGSAATAGSSDPDNSADGATGTAIALYQWDLNYDGVTFNVDATGQHAPIAAGFPAGTRTVGLRVADSDGAITTSPPQTFRINAPPGPQFAIEPLTPIVGQNVLFSSTSSDPDAADHAGALTYSWDLDGDGTFCETTGGQDEVGASVTRTFPTANVTPGHPVKLRVTDTGGITRELVRNIVVQNTIPSGGFTWSPDSPLPGQPVTFSGAPSIATAGRSIEKYEWDFSFDPAQDPAGQFEEGVQGASVDRSFASPGTHTVGLRVTESGGGFAVVFDRIVVNAPPQAAFTVAPSSAFAGETVTYSSTSVDPDGPLARHEWDLDGDGAFDDATGPVVSASYRREGEYNVGLRVTDAKGVTATAGRRVGIEAPPLALLSGVLIDIEGRLEGRLTRVTRLLVRAPRGAAVSVRCKGKSCPKKAKLVERKGRGRKRLRIRQLEGTWRPGTRIIVTITRSGYLGKKTTFKIRSGRSPLRRDLCLAPGARRATECPEP